MTYRLHIAIAVLAAFGLAGCGVKGPLEPPPGVQAAPTEHSSSTQQDGGWGKHGSKKSADPLSGVNRPDRPFILDGLL